MAIFLFRIVLVSQLHPLQTDYLPLCMFSFYCFVFSLECDMEGGREGRLAMLRNFIFFTLPIRKGGVD